MNMEMSNKLAQVYASNYIETSISEATPHKLVSLLYEGALKHLTLTKIFSEKKDFEKKSEHSNKLLSIFTALKSGVDLEVGGEVSENMYNLYDYCYRKTVEASVRNDARMLDEVQEIIQTLNEAWMQMPDNLKKASKSDLDKLLKNEFRT